MTIPDFIARCDAFCEAHSRSRVWLSKRLFNDTFRIETLAVGATDVGVRRLERAIADLTALEKNPSGHVRPSRSNGTMAPSAPEGAENRERNVSRTNEPGSRVIA